MDFSPHLQNGGRNLKTNQWDLVLLIYLLLYLLRFDTHLAIAVHLLTLFYRLYNIWVFVAYDRDIYPVLPLSRSRLPKGEGGAVKMERRRWERLLMEGMMGEDRWRRWLNIKRIWTVNLRKRGQGAAADMKRDGDQIVVKKRTYHGLRQARMKRWWSNFHRQARSLLGDTKFIFFLSKPIGKTKMRRSSQSSAQRQSFFDRRCQGRWLCMTRKYQQSVFFPLQQMELLAI